MEGDGSGAPAPVAPDAGGAPAPAPVADPTPAPAPAPSPAPAPAPTPGNPAPSNDPTIQPGQSITDMDFDSMLSELEEENPDEPPIDPNAPDPNAPPVDPNAPDPNAPPAPAPAPAPEPAAPAAPVDPGQPVDIANVDAYFNTEPDEAFGIAPVPEIRNPEVGETAQDYYKNVTLPAIVQTVKNMTGFAQRNQTIEQQAEQQQAQQAMEQRTQTWHTEIDNLVKSGAMPAYAFDAEQQVDPNSEGGKVIAETFKLMNEYNAKPENADRKIMSFDHGFRALYQPNAQAEAAQAQKDAANARRSKANSVLGGKSNGSAKGRQPGTPQHIQKGQRISDLDFDELLN